MYESVSAPVSAPVSESTPEPKPVHAALQDLYAVAQAFDRAFEESAVAIIDRLFRATVEAVEETFKAMDRERVIHENLIHDLDAAIAAKRSQLAELSPVEGQ